MVAACTGDAVKIHFTGMLDDGTVVMSTHDSEPIEFHVGDGTVIKGIDQCVVGMNVGEKRTVEVAPEDAFGERLEALMATVARSEFPSEITPQAGEIYEVKLPSGEEVNFTIMEVTDETITLDGNHPFAGQPLRFEVELIAIN